MSFFTLSGSIDNNDDSPEQGTIEVTPSVLPLTDQNGLTVARGPILGKVDKGEVLLGPLPASDCNPTFTLEIQIKLNSGKRYHFFISPKSPDTEVDINTTFPLAAPVPTSPDLKFAVGTDSDHMSFDYGPELPEAGTEGRFFMVVPGSDSLPAVVTQVSDLTNSVNEINQELEGRLSHSQLYGTFVQFVRSDTDAPLPAGHIKIKVDPTTHEIADIVWEA